MTMNTATSTSALLANEVGYDLIEDRLRMNIRATIEAVFEEDWINFWATVGTGGEKRRQRVTATGTVSGG